MLGLEVLKTYSLLLCWLRHRAAAVVAALKCTHDFPNLSLCGTHSFGTLAQCPGCTITFTHTSEKCESNQKEHGLFFFNRVGMFIVLDSWVGAGVVRLRDDGL